MRAGSCQQINGKEAEPVRSRARSPDAHRETGQTGDLTRTYMIID
jgi:hypothetical protein